MMKKLNLLAYPAVVIFSLAAASVAFAQGEYMPDSNANAQSFKSRQQVQAELMQARKDGTIKVWSNTYNPLPLAKVTKTRAEVRADRDQAYDRAWYGEDSGSVALSREQSPRVAPATYAAK